MNNVDFQIYKEALEAAISKISDEIILRQAQELNTTCADTRTILKNKTKDLQLKLRAYLNQLQIAETFGEEEVAA